LKIEGAYTFKASRQKVWGVLLNPKLIADCVPGCQELTEIGPDRYEATMKSRGKRDKGEVWIKEKREPEHCVLSTKGSEDHGIKVGDVTIDLEEKGERTVVRYSTNVEVSGWPAAFGQSILGGMAKMMVDQFFKKVESFL
jgi:uncharacterized protein